MRRFINKFLFAYLAAGYFFVSAMVSLATHEKYLVGTGSSFIIINHHNIERSNKLSVLSTELLLEVDDGSPGREICILGCTVVHTEMFLVQHKQGMTTDHGHSPLWQSCYEFLRRCFLVSPRRSIFGSVTCCEIWNDRWEINMDHLSRRTKFVSIHKNKPED